MTCTWGQGDTYMGGGGRVTCTRGEGDMYMEGRVTRRMGEGEIANDLLIIKSH